jgi:O-antigen ligase
MYAVYENSISEEDLLYEQPQRSSDIQLPPAINILLLAIWAVISLIGLAVIFLGGNIIAGIAIIALPTFIGMVIKPTFALCIMMLVLPTGSGVGAAVDFSLDRGVGLAVAVSFMLNLLMTRPRLRIDNKALWVFALYTIWVLLMSMAAPYPALEIRRAFTQFQLLVLALIVYWILYTNDWTTFRWALRTYVLGTMGTIALAVITGAAIRSMDETSESRYSATVGQAIDANMLASIVCLAFLAAIYLFARDKKLLWRLFYLISMLVFPIMLLKIGSRGALIALTFTMLSPLLFVRQVLRRPAMAVLVLAVVLLASISACLVISRVGLESDVSNRLTDLYRAEDAVSYRMMPVKKALGCIAEKPIGTSYYGWFEYSGLRIIPHNDFFMALGLYGIPAAVLFVLFMVILIFTIKRIPLGYEKLFARAILTFLLVMGLDVPQLYQKHFWVFLVFIMVSEQIAAYFTAPEEELLEVEAEEFDNETVMEEIAQ